MTLTSALLAAGSLAGLLGFAILVVATVVMSAADLTGHDLVGPSSRTGAGATSGTAPIDPAERAPGAGRSVAA